jgi:alanine racemase
VNGASRLEIDLTAVDHNLRVLRDTCSNEEGVSAKICGVVKADAYGLGATQIGHRLELGGVDMLAVYSPDEARRLIEAGVMCPILVLTPVRTVERADPLYWSIVNERLHFAIHDREQIETLAASTERLGVRLRLHLELNTGMCRAGMVADEATSVAQRIAEHPRLQLAGVYTHFAAAQSDPDQTAYQATQFSEWRRSAERSLPKDCIAHQANTCATFRSQDLHLDMIRPGLALHGFAPAEFQPPEEFDLADQADRLRPVARLVSQIVHLTTIESGQSVGYGATWTAKGKKRIAVVPVGFGDGYALALSNKGKVGFELPDGGRLHAKVVGRLSMDQMTIDVTSIPEDLVGIGAPVEVISADPEQPNSLPALAKLAKTRTHEMLCRLGPRVKRVHLSKREPRLIEPSASAGVIRTTSRRVPTTH